MGPKTFTGKITQDDLNGRILIFEPKTEDEFGKINHALRRMGCNWNGIGQLSLEKMARYTQEALEDGIVVIDKSIYTKPNAADYQGGYLCTLENLISTSKALVATSQSTPAPDNAADNEQAAQGAVDEDALKAARAEIDAMIGLGQAKKDIRQSIALSRINRLKAEMGMPAEPISMHIVFTGNPGTGKTTFARKVAKLYHALGFTKRPDVVEVTRDDLVAKYIGQTAIKTQEIIDKAAGGVLFIDEAYALTRDNSDKRDFGHEAVDTLVASMENMRDDLVVIVAGYPEEMKSFVESNVGLASRFTNYVGFEDYTLAELGQIMDQMCEQRGYKMTPEARDTALEHLEKDKAAQENARSFGNARVVRNLVEKSSKTQAERLDREDIVGRHASGEMDEARVRKALTTFTLEDVQQISLSGVQVEEGQKRGIGFTADLGLKPKTPTATMH